MHLAQASGGKAGCILDGVEAATMGYLGPEGVRNKLACPGIEVNLHEPRLVSHDPCHPAPEETREAVAKVLHQLAKNVGETSFVLSMGAMVRWAIG